MTRHSPTKAAVYVRVSSDDQTKGYGPQYQREETLTAATERDGCIVKPEHIIDDSKSGRTDNRPGWQRILALARIGAIEAIYFWKLDRMMRDEYYFYVNEKELRDLGVELRFATQDLKDPFNRAIQVAVAAEERRKIRERTYAGRIRAIRDGKWIGIPPYGYRKDKNFRLKVYPREAEWVKKFFTWLVNEHQSLGRIATRARERHVPTRYDFNNKKKPRNGPYFWSKGTLKRILSSEVYTGTAWFRKYLRSDNKLDPAKLRPESEWIKVSVPPLISAHMLQMARGQLARNLANSPRRTKRTYLFAKKLRCRICSRVITAAGASNSEYKYYRGTYCTDKRCLECRFYSERALEGAIWPGLLGFFRNPEGFIPVLGKHQARHSKQGQINQESDELGVFEQKLKRSEKMLLACELEGFYSREVLQEKRRELDSERKILDERKHELSKMMLAEEQRQAAVASAKTLYEKIQQKLNRADYETKRLAFSLFMDKVVSSRERADVWLKIPREMAAAQVAQSLSSNGTAGDNLSLRHNSYMKRDANTPDQWMPVVFSVGLKPRYGARRGEQAAAAA